MKDLPLPRWCTPQPEIERLHYLLDSAKAGRRDFKGPQFNPRRRKSAKRKKA